MAASCTGASQRTVPGGPTGFTTTNMSVLLDPLSTCSSWAAAVSAAISQGGGAGVSEPVIDAYDATVNAYCNAYPASEECRCIMFPTVAKSWCEQGCIPNSGSSGGGGSSGSFASTGSGSFASGHSVNKTLAKLATSSPPPLCSANEFGMVDSTTKESIVYQFASCDPYPCWLGQCRTMSNGWGVPLQTSAIIEAMTTPGVCSPVCYDIQAQSTQSLGPLPPGSFHVNGSLIANCGAENKPPMITSPSINSAVAVNSTLVIPLTLENQGDVVAQYSVTSNTQEGLCTLNPSSGLIYPRSGQPAQIQFNSDMVAELYKTYMSNPGSVDGMPLPVEITLTYPYVNSSMQVINETTTIDSTLTVFKAQGITNIQRPQTPSWWWFVLIIAACIVIFQVIHISWVGGKMNREAGRFLAAKAGGR